MLRYTADPHPRLRFGDLLTRLEYRYDKSSENVFGSDVAGTLKNHQSTIGAQIIYMF